MLPNVLPCRSAKTPHEFGLPSAKTPHEFGLPSSVLMSAIPNSSEGCSEG